MNLLNKPPVVFILIISIVAFAVFFIVGSTYSDFLVRIVLGGLVITTALLSLQSLFTLILMTYTWNNPQKKHLYQAPKTYREPAVYFSALIAVRNEAKVIADTIRCIDSLNYPTALRELIIVAREDDTETVEVIKKELEHAASSITLVVSARDLNNKPMSLNEGLQYAKGDAVVVFDAEDHPHQDIYHVANTVMLNREADIVQGGVQLMDYTSSWYAPHNILEYYFWFKSSLHFFARFGSVPLGGNTVFFKKSLLKGLGGWNEKVLTEDAEIGMRATLEKAKIAIVYDAEFVTKEETPPSLPEFIRQRTRWNQGFYQILRSGIWKNIPGGDPKLFTFYIFCTPIIQTIWLTYLPISLLFFWLKLPVTITLFSFVPFYFLGFQALLILLGLISFSIEYKKRLPILLPFKVLVTMYPYQILLGICAVRAMIRLFANNLSWEKTYHTNAHRKSELQPVAREFVPTV